MKTVLQKQRKKRFQVHLLETSIDGAKGVIMNITGGSNLSLFEVQEAADIVASASDEEVNMIFGSVINENLKDEIVVTVIATGFNENDLTQPAKTNHPSDLRITCNINNNRAQHQSVKYKREETCTARMCMIVSTDLR